MESVYKNSLWEIGFHLENQRDILIFVFLVSKNIRNNLNDDNFWRNWILLNLNDIDLYSLYPIGSNPSKWFHSFQKIALLKNGFPFTSLFVDQLGATFYYKVLMIQERISFYFFYNQQIIQLQHISSILYYKSFKNHWLFYGTVYTFGDRKKVEIYDKFGKLIYELFNVELIHRVGIPNFRDKNICISIDENNDKIETTKHEFTGDLIVTKNLIISQLPFEPSGIIVDELNQNLHVIHSAKMTDYFIVFNTKEFLVKITNGWIHFFNGKSSKVKFNIVPIGSFLNGFLFWFVENPKILYFITNDKWKQIRRFSKTKKVFIEKPQFNNVYDFTK